MLNDCHDNRDWIAVWMGTSQLDDDAFYAYTAGLDELDPDTPICRDMGVRMIDVDFWGSFRTAGLAVIPVEALVMEVATQTKATDADIVATAKAMGVHEGNALYYHWHGRFTPPEPGRTYNGLLFIGNFHDPKAR